MLSSWHQISLFEVCSLSIKRWAVWQLHSSYLWLCTNIAHRAVCQCGLHGGNINYQSRDRTPKDSTLETYSEINSCLASLLLFFLQARWLTFISHNPTFWRSLSDKILLCKKGQTHLLWEWLMSLKSTEPLLVSHWVTAVVPRLPHIRVNEKLPTQSIIC